MGVAATCLSNTDLHIPGSRYKTIRVLRKSLFGEVRLAQAQAQAQDTLCKRKNLVAVKLSRMTQVGTKKSWTGATLLENPLEEIRIMTILSTGGGHPHILRLLESISGNGNLWAVMDFCNGGELFNSIYKHGPLLTSRAAKLFKELIFAVEFIHGRNIAHLDLSLENMLLHDDGDGSGEHIKVSDFGMSRQFNRLQGERFTGHPGKILYMAPEVYDGKVPFDGILADVWSCGVILFIMLTGSPPWYKPSTIDENYRWIMTGNGCEKIQELLLSWKISISMPGAAIDLLSHIFCPADVRWNTSQILTHPYLH
jgi:serine/threonine protein kinase